MKYYALLTQVAGHLGSEADACCDSTKSVELVLDDSFTDCIISAAGAYFVTDALKNQLLSLEATGIRFDEVVISQSEQYSDNTQLQDNWIIPHLNALVVTGTPGKDDCGVAGGMYTLVVSERVLSAIEKAGISFCQSKEFSADASYGFWGPFGDMES